MDSINDILSGLTDEDMENLRNAAESFFSSQDSGENRGNSGPDLADMLGNAQMIAKISSLMGAMNKKDDRTRLIEALKPLLSEKRRQRADVAVQMMKLFEILPALGGIMGGDNK